MKPKKKSKPNSYMKTPSPSEWNCARELTFYLLRQLNSGLKAQAWVPNTAHEPWRQVGEYLQVIQFEEDLDEALKFTFGSAMALAGALARAHSAAAAIQVSMPDAMIAERLAIDLEEISSAVKKDQQFKAVADVAGALATALQS